MEEEIVSWWQWCRLCAKEDNENNINVASDTVIATAIGKYFWVTIKSTDISQYICQDCFKLISLLMSFTERVNKVQAMLCMLQNAKTNQTGPYNIDPYELRSQYDLLDEDFEHIVKERYFKEDVFYNEEEVEDYSENGQEEQGEPSVEDHDPKNSHIDSKIVQEIIANAKNEDNNCLNENIDDDTTEYYEDTCEKEQFGFKGLIENESGGDELEEVVQNNRKRTGNCRSSTFSDSKKQRVEQSIVYQEEFESFAQAKYTCSVCGKIYKNATSFRKHMLETHNTEPDIPDFVCEKCNKILPTVRQLIAHRRSHLPLEKKLVVPCPHCDKKFTMEAVMKQHVSSVHFNEKPFICEECGLALKSHQSFNDHKLTHSNEYPYECEVCKKKFKHKTRLKTHMDTHAETAYVCNQCGVRLNTKRTLKMHMLVHSEERAYKCNFCNAKFKRGKALKNHLILHIGLRPYKCNFCEKTFTNGSNCRSHKKRFHPAELAAEEAAGLKTEPTSVPKMSELRSREDIKRPSAISRNSGGLSSRVRDLLIASEHHKDIREKDEISNVCKAETQREKHKKKENCNDLHLVLDDTDEDRDSNNHFEEYEETVIYEFKPDC